MTTHLTPERLAEIKAYCEKVAQHVAAADNWVRVAQNESLADRPGLALDAMFGAYKEFMVAVSTQSALIESLKTDLPAAVEEIERLRAQLKALDTANERLAIEREDYERRNILLDRSEKEMAGNLRVSRAECEMIAGEMRNARVERDALRQQLAEAKGENADLRERLQRQREQIQRQPAHVCGPDENCGACIECALMAQGAELERVSQALQQANAASGGTKSTT